MDIRQAIRSDTPQLNELGPRVCANAVRGFGVAFDPASWHCAIDEFLRLPDRRLFVAADAERIIGVLAVVACPVLFARASSVMRVVTLWVDQGHRGQGHARALCAAAEDWARFVGASAMLAGVPHSYAAHTEFGDSASADDANRFYREQGYRLAEVSLVKEIH